MNDIEVTTLVQHYVCRIFQDAARLLEVGVIRIPDADARRLEKSTAELEDVLANFLEAHASRDTRA